MEGVQVRSPTTLRTSTNSRSSGMAQKFMSIAKILRRKKKPALSTQLSRCLLPRHFSAQRPSLLRLKANRHFRTSLAERFGLAISAPK
jgi:hypothetical protein